MSGARVRPYIVPPTGDRYTDAILQISFNSLYFNEHANTFTDFTHFIRYFTWALHYLCYDKGKLRHFSDAETFRWKYDTIKHNWFNASMHWKTTSYSDMARILYARYVKRPCESEAGIRMDVFRPTDRSPPFCRPIFGGAASSGGGGGGGLGTSSSASTVSDRDWERQVEAMNAISNELAGMELKTLLDRIPVPREAPSVATRVAVAVAMPRGGRRRVLPSSAPKMTVTIKDTYVDSNRRMRDGFECRHGAAPPPLRIEAVPPGTTSIAVQMYDVTASFTHWLAWNVGTANERVGLNSYRLCDYSAPCPPEDGDVHTYVITAYALPAVPAMLRTNKPVTKPVFDRAMAKAASATAQTVLYFSR